MNRSPIGRRAFLHALTGTAATGVALGSASAAPRRRLPGPATRLDAAGRPPARSRSRSAQNSQEGYEPLGRLPVDGLKEVVVGPDGTTVYCAVTDGFVVADVSDPAEPTLLAERRGLLADREDGPLQQVYDVKVEGDRLLLGAPANPGQDDLRAAVLYDVSDPASPEQLGVYETEFFHHNVFLSDGLAYLSGNGADGAPLVVVDVEAGEEVGRWSITSEAPGWSDLPPGLWTLHDLWVQDGVAYLAHWDAGTWIVDVSDPSNPAFVAKARGRSPEAFADRSDEALQVEAVEPPGNDHFVTVNDDASVLGIGVESWDVDADDDHGGPGGIDLYDVSDPSSPTHLSAIEPPPTDDASFGGTWVTSHNFDLVGDRLYSSWYAGGVRVFDVSDPSSPALLSAWRDSAAASFWTAQAAKPGEFYVAGSRRAPEENSQGAALYTFPDTTDAATGTTADGTNAGTSTATSDGGDGDDGSDVSDGSDGSDGGDGGDATATDDASTVDGPGFGVGAAVTALGVAAWRASRGARDSK